MRGLRLVLAAGSVAPLGFVAAGCGEEAGLSAAGDTGEAVGDMQPAGPPSAPALDDAELDEFGRANLAPGYRDVQYPLAPYGVAAGSVAADMELLGWYSPLAEQYDIGKAVPIRLSDFYDPSGSKGVELLLVSAVAVWCGVCRTEFADIQTKSIYSTLGPRGLEVLGILFEDNDAEPARYADLVNWARAYGVDFPMVMDPGFKSGIYFDRSATPMNMLIDARNMQIMLVMTGYNPDIYDYIDQVLAQRGR